MTWSSVVEGVDFALNNLRMDIWKQNDYDLGVYIQDKMEDQDDVLAMVGIRVDYFKPNGFDDPIL